MTPLLAAAERAPSIHDQAVLVVAAALILAGWLVAVWWRPYIPCPAKHGRRRRTCRRCRGKGRVLRPGAHLIYRIRHNTRKGG